MAGIQETDPFQNGPAVGEDAIIRIFRYCIPGNYLTFAPHFRKFVENDKSREFDFEFRQSNAV